MLRFEPALAHGNNGWRVDICTGNRKRGTFRASPVTEPVYTLAQAQSFCSNNRVSDYAHLLNK
jgi:hypothetical protein